MTRITLTGGGTAEILETDAVTVALRASRSSPPGSTLAGTDDMSGTTYKIKVRGCRKLADEDGGGFRIEGRFVDLPRAAREALLVRRPR